MMAISRNPNEYAFVHALEPPGGRRRLSAKTMAAIGIAGAVHVGLLAYLYETHFNVAADTPTKDVVITTYPWPKTTPAKTPPPLSHPAVRHVATVVDPTKLDQIIPVHIDPQKTIIADNTATLDNSSSARTAPDVIVDPQWVSLPSAAQMAAYYPDRPLEAEIGGNANLTCSVIANGALTNCQIASETPANMGFGQAALKLTRFFKMSPRTENGRVIDGALVRIRLEFQPQG